MSWLGKQEVTIRVKSMEGGVDPYPWEVSWGVLQSLPSFPNLGLY